MTIPGGPNILGGAIWPDDATDANYPTGAPEYEVPALFPDGKMRFRPGAAAAGGHWEVMLYEGEPMLYNGDWMYYFVED